MLKKMFALLAAGCALSLMAQQYVIKLPDAPKSYEQTAAKELGDYLAKRLGDNKLIIDGKSPVTFHIGDTDLAKREKCLSTEIEDERWFIRSFGDEVLINGGGSRGALNATYHFLEDYCDVHWWSDFEEYVPAQSELTLGKLDATGKPAFKYRDIYRNYLVPQGPYMAARNRLSRNGDGKLPLALGGEFSYGSPTHSHSFELYVPAAKYLETHPEYFSYHDGKRVGGGSKGQLCLTNSELIPLFLAKLRDYIRTDREKAAKDGVSVPMIYDISMNDATVKCECDKCLAAYEKYNISGVYLRFVNALAVEIRKDYPEIFLSTLAYHFTEEPPKGGVVAEDNVIIKLCDTQTNQAVSILHEDNKIFRDFIGAWKKVAKHILVWDYAVTYEDIRGLPFASEFHYGDTIKYYLENNVFGIFWEHEYPHDADFFELKYFLEAKLMEDPYQDVNKLIGLFMDRYFGVAAPYMLAYRKLLDEARTRNAGYVNWNRSVGTFAFIRSADIEKAQELFDKALEAASGDALITSRVKRSRIGLDKLSCYRAMAFFYHGKENKIDTLNPDIGQAAKERLSTVIYGWIEKWPEDIKARIKREYTEELKAFDYIVRKCPPPPELKNVSFFDCYAPHFKNHAPKIIKIVEDRDSLVGQAMRVEADAEPKGYYYLPFAVGVYSVMDNRNVRIETFDKPIGTGYNWYKLPGLTELPRDGHIYITRSWCIQLSTAAAEITGRKLEIWVSAKFVGPKYFDGQEGPNYLYVDRVALLEK